MPVRRKSHTPYTDTDTHTHTHSEALDSDPDSFDTLSDDESFWSAAASASASVEYRAPARKLTPFPMHSVVLGAGCGAEERGGRLGLTLIPEGGSTEEVGGSGREEEVRRMKLKGKYRADEVVDGVGISRETGSVGAVGGEGMWLRSKSRRGGEVDDRDYDYGVERLKVKARYCAGEPVDGGRRKDTNRVRNRESEDSFIGRESQQRSYGHQGGREMNDRDQDQDHTWQNMMFTTNYRAKDAMDDGRHQGSSLIHGKESKYSLARKKVQQPSYHRKEGNSISERDYAMQSATSTTNYHTNNPMDDGRRKGLGKEPQRPPHSYQDGNETSDRDEEILSMTSTLNYRIGDFDPQQPSFIQQESNNTSQENPGVERVKPNTKATDNTTASSWASSSKHPPTDRKSTRLNSSHSGESRMPSSA